MPNNDTQEHIDRARRHKADTVTALVESRLTDGTLNWRDLDNLIVALIGVPEGDVAHALARAAGTRRMSPVTVRMVVDHLKVTRAELLARA